MLKKDLQDASASIETAPTPSTHDTPDRLSIEDLRGMRILIVDDMPTNIILIRAILEHGGFSNIITASDGSKAISHLQQQTQHSHCDIDLLLLDIIMPSTDGFSVCRAMQSNHLWRLIPTIMITSENKWRDEAALASFESGATDIMFKPVRSIELLPRVISALTWKRERDIILRREQELKHQLHEYQIAETRLNYLVNHDDLTGLFNRRFLEQTLNRSAQNPGQHDRDSSLLHIDIDHFRVINDSEGTHTGDQLLFEFSSFLREHFSHQAVIARVAGDGFAVLLENTPLQLAIQHAESFQTACVQYKFTYPLTVSIGLASINNTFVTETGNALVQAEQASHIARLHGGDSLHVFKPSGQ